VATGNYARNFKNVPEIETIEANAALNVIIG
jgi:hypothetical protein